MQMKVFFHTDDVGLTRRNTETIVNAWEKGFLDSVSILANGAALSFLAQTLQEEGNRHLRIAIHLNLTDGKPILPPSSVTHLVTKDGFLKFGFLKLLLVWLVSPKQTRTLLVNEITREWLAQIRMVKAVLGNRCVASVDGHNHIHMLPFLFPVVINLAKEEGIPSIRLSREFFFFSSSLRESLRVSFLLNIVKYMVLRICSLPATSILRHESFLAPDSMVGILYTGMMSYHAAMAGIRQAKKRGALTTEVVFHIGRSAVEEFQGMGISPAAVSFYIDPARDNELTSLELLGKMYERESIYHKST